MWRPPFPSEVGWSVTPTQYSGAGGRASASVVRRPALPYHRDLDLPWVLDLLLHRPGDLARQQGRGIVVDLLGPHDHPDLAPGVHRVDLLDAGVAAGDLLQVVQAGHVVLERLPAGP